MMMRRRWITRCAGTAVAVATGFVLMGAPIAQAHPLGNFSVNRAHNLTFQRGLIVDRAIVDLAEIPTAQAEGRTDADGDGQISPSEFERRAQSDCADVVTQLTLNVDSVSVPFALIDATFAYQPGQAGLPTGRLECRLEAIVDLTASHQVSFRDAASIDRVGWREIIAQGDGVRLLDSPVPQTSTTDELRTYPVDLLDSPLDVHQLIVSTAPGGAPLVAPAIRPTKELSPSGGTSMFSGGPLSGVVDHVTERFNELVGRRDLTLGVGLLAVTLAMILGASHALLPGHGKTVMAAYIAGRQGSSRDAFVVGATVTATHTGGVLVLGLALTLSSSLAGESVLSWLGVVSGAIITVLGGTLLLGAIRHRVPAHGHRHSFGSHDHDHGHGHGHGDHGHHHNAHVASGRDVRPARRRTVQIRGGAIAALAGHVGDDDATTAGNVATIQRAGVGNRTATISRSRIDTATSVSSRLSLSLSATSRSTTERAPTTIVRGGDHRIATPHVTTPVVSRRGLIGMGIAGGLVPSPSALIVLLSAIALGRTVFGIVLVIGYGMGMAATLTLAGLLLVRVRDRYQQRSGAVAGRASKIARRWTAVTPYATSVLVLVVGIGIAARALSAM